MYNLYSVSRMEKEFGISIKPIKNILRYFEFEPIVKKSHAGKTACFYLEEDALKLKEFYNAHSKKERFNLLKKKFGKDFGPTGPSKKFHIQNIWCLKTIEREVDISKKGLESLLTHLFNESLEIFLKEPQWEKLRIVKKFYRSLGSNNYDRGRKLASFKNLQNHFREKQKKNLKKFYTKLKEKIDSNKWVTRENARNFLGKNDPTTYILYKMYGFRFFKKSHILFYNREDLKKLKNIINSKKVNLGLLHNAFNERLFKENISYIREKNFKELGNKRFDFYIPSKNMLIEIQGSQHFNGYNFIGKITKEKQKELLKERLDSDNSKIEFCRKKGIDLVWITEPSDLEDFFNFYLKGISKKGLYEWFHRGHLPIEVWEKDKKKWNLNWKGKELYI